MQVGISSTAEGAEQDNHTFLILELLPVSSTETIGMRAQTTNATIDHEGAPSSHHECQTAPTVAIPPSFIKIDKTD